MIIRDIKQEHIEQSTLLVVPYQGKPSKTYLQIIQKKNPIIYCLRPTLLVQPETCCWLSQTGSKQSFSSKPSLKARYLYKKSRCPCCFFSGASSYWKIISSPAAFCKHPTLPPLLIRVLWRGGCKEKPCSGSPVLKCSSFPEIGSLSLRDISHLFLQGFAVVFPFNN